MTKIDDVKDWYHGNVEEFEDAQDPETLPMFIIDDYLPQGIFHDYCFDICRALQVTPDFAGMAMLTTVSACVHHKFYIEAKAGYVQPLNLYTAIIAPSGAGKSPVYRQIMKPIADYQYQKNKERDSDRIKYKQKKKDAERELKRLERKEDKDALQSGDKLRIEQLKQMLNDMEMHPVNSYRITTSDSTAEALAPLMAENNESINVFADEADMLDTIAGRYSADGKAANIALFLNAWDEGQYLIDRKTNNLHIMLNKPSMCILLCAQPSAIDTAMKNTSLSGRGFWQRFCYVVAHTDIEKEWIHEDAAEHYQRYADALNRLLDMPDDKPPVILKFSDDVNPMLEKEFKSWNAIIREQENEDIRTWCSKAFGLECRIAGVLHIMVYGVLSGEYRISKELFSMAMQITDFYLMRHAEYIFTKGGTVRNQSEETGLYIIKKILKLQPEGYVTIRNDSVLLQNVQTFGNDTIPYLKLHTVYQACKHKCDTRKKLQIGLDELIRRNYIRIGVQTPEGGGKPVEYILYHQDVNVPEETLELSLNREAQADQMEEIILGSKY